MTTITIAQMKNEMIVRLDEQLDTLRSTMNAMDALDRLGDYDLHDQMITAEKLMSEMDQLITRMNSIVRS